MRRHDGRGMDKGKRKEGIEGGRWWRGREKDKIEGGRWKGK